MSRGEWKANNLGKRLRRARQGAGLTQAELADRLDTRQANVSRVEAGQKPRKPLYYRIVGFIQEAERSRVEVQDDIVSRIGNSDEFKAFVARIAAEL